MTSPSDAETASSPAAPGRASLASSAAGTFTGRSLRRWHRRLLEIARRTSPDVAVWLAAGLQDMLPPAIARRYYRSSAPSIPERELYVPLYSPWLAQSGEFSDLLRRVRPYSLVGPDRLWILHSLARQALRVPGDFIEAGVYRGGTALLFREAIVRSASSKSLHLFDTFSGMPATDPERDLHRAGDFSATSLEGVRRTVGADDFIHYHPGLIPGTFQGLDSLRFSLCHIDLDIYQAILDACTFAYPRLSFGGFMVFDDYGFASCPGARKAVDEFFADKPEAPIVLPTGQAVVFRAPEL